MRLLQEGLSLASAATKQVAAEGGEVLVMGGELVEGAPAVLGALLAGGEAFGRSGEAGDALVVVGATTAVPTELRMLDVAGAALSR